MNKLFLDTNVFIRLLIQDIKDQFEKAQAVFDEIETGRVTALVSVLVINEIVWILENYYKIERDNYIPPLLNLLAIKNLRIFETKKDLIISCLRTMQKRNFDFTDVYLSHITKKERLFSFDKDFDKLFSAKVK